MQLEHGHLIFSQVWHFSEGRQSQDEKSRLQPLSRLRIHGLGGAPKTCLLFLHLCSGSALGFQEWSEQTDEVLVEVISLAALSLANTENQLATERIWSCVVRGSGMGVCLLDHAATLLPRAIQLAEQAVP